MSISRKIVIGIFIGGCILSVFTQRIFNSSYDYTFKYQRLLEEVTDVPGSEFISNKKLHYFTRPIRTRLDITISNENMSKEEALEMAKNIAAKIDELLPKEETKGFALNFSVNLKLEIVERKMIDNLIVDLPESFFEETVIHWIIGGRHEIRLENGEYKLGDWYFKF